LERRVPGNRFVRLEPTSLAGKVLDVGGGDRLSIGEEGAKPDLTIRRHRVQSLPPRLGLLLTTGMPLADLIGVAGSSEGLGWRPVCMRRFRTLAWALRIVPKAASRLGAGHSSLWGSRCPTTPPDPAQGAPTARPPRGPCRPFGPAGGRNDGEFLGQLTTGHALLSGPLSLGPSTKRGHIPASATPRIGPEFGRRRSVAAEVEGSGN
jgi:hypothetical protein